jgi:hypothetical protein
LVLSGIARTPHDAGNAQPGAHLSLGRAPALMRVLSLDEITHVSAIANSLAFTIVQMARIDEAYRAAFPDRG